MADALKPVKGSLERRIARVGELRAEDLGGGKRVLRGYSAVYDLESDLLGGWFVEVIRQGAFDDVLKAAPDVRCLFNHDPNQVLGRTKAGTLALRADARGLHMECQVPTTRTADDVYAMVTRGDVSQQSFAFVVGEDRWTFSNDRSKPTLREILRVAELYDVGPVTFPAYPDTDVGARSGVSKADAEAIYQDALARERGQDDMRLARLRLAEAELRG